MTTTAEEVFREDAYLRECDATVTRVGDGAFYVDRTVFYPLGGGQPGDTGTVRWEGGGAKIVDTRYGDERDIAHIVEEGAPLSAQDVVTISTGEKLISSKPA